MSIQKDVKKMYINDLERENKRLKKKRKKRLLSVILAIILIAVLILLFNYLGLGFGGGKGNGGENGGSAVSQNSSAAETSATTVTTEAPKILVDIKVSGSTYIYDGQEVTLDVFKARLAPMSDNVIINVIDDNATENAVKNLEDMLDSEGRQFTVAQDNSDSSSADSLSESSKAERNF